MHGPGSRVFHGSRAPESLAPLNVGTVRTRGGPKQYNGIDRYLNPRQTGACPGTRCWAPVLGGRGVGCRGAAIGVMAYTATCSVSTAYDTRVQIDVHGTRALPQSIIQTEATGRTARRTQRRMWDDNLPVAPGIARRRDAMNTTSGKNHFKTDSCNHRRSCTRARCPWHQQIRSVTHG